MPEPDTAVALAAFFTWWRRSAVRTEYPSSSLSVLDLLDRAGPHRISDLAVRERLTQPGMTALVTRLAVDGVVEKLSDPADGRVALVRITETGRLRIKALRADRADQLDRCLQQLDPADRAALTLAVPALTRLVTATDPDAGTPTSTHPVPEGPA